MNSADLERLSATKIIDARMDVCPGPLLEAKEGIELVNAGEVIEIQARDPEARGDISAWAMKAGHEFWEFSTLVESIEYS